MTQRELENKLRDMYESAYYRRERTFTPILFGILYANHLRWYDIRGLREMGRIACGSVSYGDKIRDGVRMSSYIKTIEYDNVRHYL